MTIPHFPTNTPATKALILNEIGRDVDFFTIYSSLACSVCNLDPVTDESTDSECEFCSGVYWIPIWSSDTLLAHVTWKYSENREWDTGGIVFLGDCLIKVMSSGNADSIVNNAEYVIVDDRVMDIEKITRRGVTVLDRIIVDLKERSQE